MIVCLCAGPLYNSSNIYEELERGEAVLLERVEEARSATFSLAIQYIILKVYFSLLPSSISFLLLERVEEARSATFSFAIQYVILKV